MVHDPVERHNLELALLQHFHTPSPRGPASRHRGDQELPHRPVVALTNGDPFFNGFFRPAFPRMFLQAGEVADIVLSTSMGVSADRWRERLIRRLWRRFGEGVAVFGPG